jgi:hypothetical protein
MIESAALWFLGAGALAFLVAGAWSPFEALSWWAGGHGALAPSGVAGLQTPPGGDAGGASTSHYVVYLGGIDTIDGTEHSDRERRFLAALGEGLEDVSLVQTVFPYAVTGEPLLSAPRAFRWLWRRAAALPGAKRTLLANLINLRNLFQVLVAADRRYGPIFDGALAQLILEALARAGWRPGAQRRVSLIGYSGGAQMAMGAAANLTAFVDGPIDIVSLGGTIIATRGLDHVARLDHLTGADDFVPRLAAIAAPSRWPPAVLSSWARAEREGRIHRIALGAMGHNGFDGYLGEAQTAQPGRPNWEITVVAVRACLIRPIGPSWTPSP